MIDDVWWKKIAGEEERKEKRNQRREDGDTYTPFPSILFDGEQAADGPKPAAATATAWEAEIAPTLSHPLPRH